MTVLLSNSLAFSEGTNALLTRLMARAAKNTQIAFHKCFLLFVHFIRSCCSVNSLMPRIIPDCGGYESGRDNGRTRSGLLRVSRAPARRRMHGGCAQRSPFSSRERQIRHGGNNLATAEVLQTPVLIGSY